LNQTARLVKTEQCDLLRSSHSLSPALSSVLRKNVQRKIKQFDSKHMKKIDSRQPQIFY